MADEIIVRIKAEGQEKFIEELKKAGVQVEKTKKQTDKAVAGISKSVKRFGVLLLGAFSAAKIKQFVDQSLKAFATFDNALKELSAITGLVGSDLDKLSASAKKLAGQSRQSATEVLNAFKLIGSAKPEILADTKALEGLTEAAITLAEASGMDLPTSAMNLGNALNALQLPAEEAGRLINVLASASQKGAKEIPFIANALSKFGGISAQAGLKVEESVSAVELLGKAIPQAETVGTGLRNILIKMQVEASKSGREFNSLAEELERLAPYQTDVAELTKRFGEANVLAVQTLITEREELVSLTNAITGTNTAYEQQITNNQSYQASLEKLNNQVEIFKINAGEFFSGAAKPFVDGLAGMFGAINSYNKATVTALEATRNWLNELEDTRSLEDIRKELDEVNRQLEDPDTPAEFFETLAIKAFSLNQELRETTSLLDDIAEAGGDLFRGGDVISQDGLLQIRTFEENLENLRNNIGTMSDNELKALERYFNRELAEAIKGLNQVVGDDDFAELLRENYTKTINDARQGLDLLENGAVKLSKAQIALIDEFAKATNQTAQYTTAFLGLAQAWKDAGGDVKVVEGSIADLSAKLKKAKEDLENLVPGTQAFEDQVKRIKTLEDELKLIEKLIANINSGALNIEVELEGETDPTKSAEKIAKKFLKTFAEAGELVGVAFAEGLSEGMESSDALVQGAKAYIKQSLQNVVDASSGLGSQDLIERALGLKAIFDDPSTENYEKGLLGVAEGLQSLSQFEELITGRRLDRLEEQRRRGEISEKEFARKRAEIVRQEAIFQKVTALSQAVVNTALGATAQFKAGPEGLPLALLVTALGAAQVALIASQPIPDAPQFAKGTKGSQKAPAGLKKVHKDEWIVDEGGYDILTASDSKEIGRILAGYGVPVNFTSTEGELAKPLSRMRGIKDAMKEVGIDLDPLLFSGDKNRRENSRRLDNIYSELRTLNDNFTKGGLNARI